jgi:hypothetical protein
MAFFTNAIERARITSAGNVGIGTTSPGARLEVRNDVGAATSLEPTAIKLYNNSDGGSGIEFSNGVSGKSKVSFGVTSTGAGTDDTYIAFSTSPNAGALVERMRIDASGNVGIGTTSPSQPLHVNGFVRLFGISVNETGGTVSAFIGYEKTWLGTGSSNSLAIASETGNNIKFYTNGSATERASISTGGAFDITGTLAVSGNVGIPNGVQMGFNGLNSTTRIYAFGGSGQAMSLDAAGTNCLYLGASTVGSVQVPSIGTTASAANAFLDSATSNLVLRSTSSIRYKRDVETLETQYADNVLALRPVWYRSKAERDNKDWGWYGLIAEETAEIDPRLVHWGYIPEDYEDVVVAEAVESEDGTTTPARTERRVKVDATLKPDGVQYERLSVLLLDVVKRQQKSLQEAMVRIEALEAKNAVLEADIQQLKQ